MNVTDAVMARKTIRDFLPDPIDNDTIAELLTTASRSPSGGNLQPWRIYVVNGDSMAAFREHMATAANSEGVEYDIYPPKLWDPYRSRRFAVGEQMYATIGICLLYTSPSPRDATLSRMPSSA